MTAIKYTKDRNGVKVFPITHIRAVRDNDGNNLEALLGALQSNAYIIAWDGTSAPTVANIPAGVTVTYSSTTYTGTLAASASTLGKIYLVHNGTDYDRHITSYSGAAYSWVALGTIAMDLTNYISKSDGLVLGTIVETL